MTEQAFDVIEGLAPLIAGKSCTMSQFALAWCLQKPGVTSPIIGPRTMDQLSDNLGALGVSVTAEDNAQVDDLIAPGQMVSPFYEANFGPHPFR